ncbi:thioredoxin domain-containing protein [Qipengyuania marisflavi]|uniref:Protein-disulfide isomerase n=1 Tax=Qipengyuania marisflavi TaxID=2486356 RepID=A0A5S3P9Z3_9SPHN|nr:thioredoxin domain-containing protein [Qipengyuania marisflavi]TMM50324.1 protein-disulfide isomerase [Qipengyuania marisflavi]
MIKTLRFAIAAPLALALASCNSGAEEPGSLEGDAIAAVPAPAGSAWRDTVQVTKYNGHLVGNPDAPIKLVEYGSLTCPTCARFSVEGVEPLMDKYVNSGVVSFELRNFALHGTVDVVLARLARCSSPEAVVPLSDQIWANLETLLAPLQTNAAALEAAMQQPMEQRFGAFAQVAGYYDFFAARGISEDQARSCLADIPAMEQLAEDTRAQGEEFSITGTPTLMVNGQKVDAITWSALEPILQRAGAR